MDTRQALIGKATALARERGFSGFSYADLEKTVGLRKASIHYHFPSKADLGLGMVQAYREGFRAELARIETEHKTAASRLGAYASLYRAGAAARRGCLCGVLASEYPALPKPVRAAVKRFFEENIAWIEKVLAEGRDNGEVREGSDVAGQARMMFSMLQGAMVVARPLGDLASFDAAFAAALAAIEA